ncbi:hypothetical protein [Microbulbifer taiwanensis]
MNERNPTGTERLFTEHKFFTATGRARFISVQPRTPEQSRSDEFPFG